MEEMKFKTWGDVIKDNTEFAEKKFCFMLPQNIRLPIEVDGEKMLVNVNSIALTEYGTVWAFTYGDDKPTIYYVPVNREIVN